MVIKQISYGRTIATKNYENVRLDMTATVAPDEAWEDVLADLKNIMRAEEKKIHAEQGIKPAQRV